jgi:hypothetical protein
MVPFRSFDPIRKTVVRGSEARSQCRSLLRTYSLLSPVCIADHQRRASMDFSCNRAMATAHRTTTDRVTDRAVPQIIEPCSVRWICVRTVDIASLKTAQHRFPFQHERLSMRAKHAVPRIDRLFAFCWPSPAEQTGNPPEHRAS